MRNLTQMFMLIANWICRSIDLNRDFIEPRDRIEQQLAKIWKELLCCKSLSIHNNFFELGEHPDLAVVLLVIKIKIDSLSNARRTQSATLL